MSNDAFVKELVDALGDVVVTDANRLASYREDRAMFCDAGTPCAVVLARETAHVSDAVRLASAHGVPIVAQGARSGLSGAANAIEGGLVVALERMDRVLEIDEDERLVVTQPGVFNADLSRAVADRGLFYPPDPSSWEFCTIGGNLATNSGGLCCVKYGVTTDYVLALEVVLASGEVLRTGRRTVKGVAGYDLTRLFVGSEGTLGIITEATLRLRPAAHRPRTLAATFDSVHDAAQGISAITRSTVIPNLLELMDATSVRAVDRLLRLGFEERVGALVLAQSDAAGVAGEEEIAQIAAHLRDAGAYDVVLAEDEAEAALLLTARRQVLTAFEAMGTTMVDDVCVPRHRIVDLVVGVEEIAVKHDVVIGVVGHAGDGNFHPSVIFDGDDPDQAARAHAAFDDIMLLGLTLGGTITGEHGVGVLKRELLAREIGPVGMSVHRAIKDALDPRGLLNPGKVL
ncbi:FAD-binding oxidoreductase [Mumia zhuanghuii]|uniref:FAD-binding protein n=1 Tax=Mumia zhuanghuii TaxID=2585211 RepID=A0A5C4MFZ7_9ACTN|nr:FAD-linked oxidase C-terminal domain-containing protein [Mumia zhuanghuii]TNC39869.1 FAD-binding protein [Mumia zhuanghuii]TNC41770.1 FAD-binding protein [Mumia zhuanghuii]